MDTTELLRSVVWCRLVNADPTYGQRPPASAQAHRGVRPRRPSAPASRLPGGPDLGRVVIDHVLQEPISRQLRNALERAGLLEQMRRARHDLDALVARERVERLQVQLEHLLVVLADDQERGRL